MSIKTRIRDWAIKKFDLIPAVEIRALEKKFLGLAEGDKRFLVVQENTQITDSVFYGGVILFGRTSMTSCVFHTGGQCGDDDVKMVTL